MPSVTHVSLSRPSRSAKERSATVLLLGRRLREGAVGDVDQRRRRITLLLRPVARAQPADDELGELVHLLLRRVDGLAPDEGRLAPGVALLALTALVDVPPERVLVASDHRALQLRDGGVVLRILRRRRRDEADALRIALPPALAALAPVEVLDDQPGRVERTEVVARRPARLAELAAEHRSRRRTVRQRFEHPQPERVGECADLLGAERAG